MRVGIGEDSHRFDFEDKEKKLILAGVTFEGHAPLLGNSDADVVLHAITNAISGVTCVNILGPIADKMCKELGITDSRAYLAEAAKHLNGKRIVHLSISIEGLTPKITPRIPEMRASLSKLLNLKADAIAITATTGEGLTQCGQGLGLHVFSCITVI